jgi:glucans biosynthesis protein
MHGGANGSGAPRGNKNALKDGAYTYKELERRAQMRGLLRQARKLLKELG